MYLHEAFESGLCIQTIGSSWVLVLALQLLLQLSSMHQSNEQYKKFSQLYTKLRAIRVCGAILLVALSFFIILTSFLIIEIKGKEMDHRNGQIRWH